MADWRTENAKWTRGQVFRFEKYTPQKPDWDHDHCEGCWAKFMESDSPGVMTEGYVTQNNRWICAQCFSDLHDEMGWKLA